jgi:hypothetical protein
MATTKKSIAHVKPGQLLDHVKQLASEVPLEKLTAGLKKVANARGLTGANLDLRFRQMDDPYYNVYRYAFFGKAPERGEEVEARMATGRGKRIFGGKRKQ